MRRTLAILAISSFTLAPLCAQQSAETKLLDNSDWWTFYAMGSSLEGVTPQHRTIALESLAIAGVTLTEQMPGQIDSTFGKAAWVTRGEDSSERHQACYISAEDGAPTYLIFEDGIESNTSFYLFRGGPAWKGGDLCVRSTAVTGSLATPSGIHLGQSMDQVIAILGAPSKQTDTELRYILDQRVKLSDKQLNAIRTAAPAVVQSDFDKWAADHPTFEFLELLTARFDDNGLKYFSVTAAFGG
jgi:hypothetical protein